MPETNLTRDNSQETRDIGVAGMTCDKCVQRVEKALKNEDGVLAVRVDRQSARATVTFDAARTDIPKLHEAILRSGYQPQAVRAQ
jgi:copper chaperone CopZ